MGSRPIKIKSLKITDPGKTQNLETSLKVQSGLKIGGLLENLVQVCKFPGRAEITVLKSWKLSKHKHTEYWESPQLLLLGLFLTLATWLISSGKRSEQPESKDLQMLTFKRPSNQTYRCWSRGSVWVAWGRSDGNRITPSSSRVRSL